MFNKNKDKQACFQESPRMPSPKCQSTQKPEQSYPQCLPKNEILFSLLLGKLRHGESNKGIFLGFAKQLLGRQRFLNSPYISAVL